MHCLVILLLAVLLCTCGPAPAEDRTERPNILFILTDDQGIGDLYLHGNDSISTPHLDALLQSSARFDRFYVSPVCAPTRASFLSGQYHPRTGAVFVTRRRETMHDGVTTIAEMLGTAGYRTGLFGKWHNGATFPYHPGGQGFDEFLGFTLGHFNDYFRGELQNESDELVPFTGDLTKILTDSAAHFMLEESERPFFAMLAYQAPHTPVQVAENHWQRNLAKGLTAYNAGIYAMVESIDAQVGSLLERLERAGKLENTIVIFSTDNGPNGDRYRRGLRGTKGHIDEGGVRVPFGIRLPGKHPANDKLFTTPAAHIDLLPTLADLVNIPPVDPVDGVSLRPLLEGGALEDRYIFAFRQGYEYTGVPGSMRNEDYLYVLRDSANHELYDLSADPGQQHDIYHMTGGTGPEMAAHYAAFASSIARPELIAPPIDLDAAPATVRLLAHEGEPLGSTRFADQYGWANDFFVDLGPDGAEWPIVNRKTTSYGLVIRYHLDAESPRTLTVAAGGEPLRVALPVAKTEQLPVADRVERKEVYPRSWAEIEVAELHVTAGARVLRISGEPGTGLWVKELWLKRLRLNAG